MENNITVFIEKETYRGESGREIEVRDFYSLGSLADWIFDQMAEDYTDPVSGSAYLAFPTREPDAIRFKPMKGGPSFIIHKIMDDGDGIIFSDGVMTAGRRHWSPSVQEWCLACEARRQSPTFNFVE